MQETRGTLLDQVTYERIYPRGSQPARIYVLTKMHKSRAENSLPPLDLLFLALGVIIMH